MKKLDKTLSKDDITKILNAHDDAKDGRISFEEFKIMMIGDDDTLVRIKTDID